MWLEACGSACGGMWGGHVGDVGSTQLLFLGIKYTDDIFATGHVPRQRCEVCVGWPKPIFLHILYSFSKRFLAIFSRNIKNI